ncbi:MAG: caspase family protein, partial [Chloroflexota bacterium]
MILLAAALALLQDPAPQPFFAPRRRALVVGASQYEHLGRLRYAAGDAEKFAAALTGRLGFEADAVKLLTDETADPLLTPTAGHVLGELEALLADQRGAATDLFVFYFSGHGIGLPEGDYLMPTDARMESAVRVGLPVREIVERLATARMKNVLVIVDACREGEANAFGAELRALGDAARIAVVLGCEPGQRSYEDARLGGGIFTASLLQSLNEEGLRDPVSGA